MNKQKQVTTYTKTLQSIVIILNNMHDLNKTLEGITNGLAICLELKVVIIKIEIRLTDLMLEKLASGISKCQLCEKVVIISQKCGDYSPLLQKFFEKLVNLKYLTKFEAQIEFKIMKNNSTLVSFFKQLQFLNKLSYLKQIDIKFQFSKDIEFLQYDNHLTQMFKGLKKGLPNLHYIRVNFGDFECFKLYVLSDLKRLFGKYPKILFKIKSLAIIDIDFIPQDPYNDFNDIVDN